MLSFIKLFEDFSDSDSWTVVRDVIQSRRPFTIIVFRTKPSYLKAIETSFKEIDYIKQTAVMIIDGKTLRYPSIFFVLDQNQNYEPEIKELYSKFDIKQVVIGEANVDYSTLYLQDGTSSDFGNEIVSALSPDDFKSEDHFKVGGTYYRFVSFNG